MEWFWMKSMMCFLQLPGYASTLLMTHYKSLKLSLTLPTVSGSDHPNEMFASWAHVFHTSNFTHLPVQVLTVLKHSFALVAQWWSHAQSGRAQVSQFKKFSKRLEAECGYVDWQVHVCSILLYYRRLTMFQCVPMVHGHASNNRNLVLIKLHKKVLNKNLGGRQWIKTKKKTRAKRIMVAEQTVRPNCLNPARHEHRLTVARMPWLRSWHLSHGWRTFPVADREIKQVKGEVLEVSNGSCRSFSFPFSRTLLQSQSGWAAMRKMEKLCTRRTEMDSCTDGKKKHDKWFGSCKAWESKS